MKTLLASATLSLFATLVAVRTSSAQTAQFIYSDGVGTLNAGDFAPGSSFTFSINLAFVPSANVPNLEGLSYYFEQQNSNAPFYFSLTNRDATGSQFTDLQTPGLTYPQALAPANANDLGALLPGNTGVGLGTYFIANLTVTISPSAAPGIYLLENTTTGGKRSVITDDQGNTAPISQSVYTVTVIPEPTTNVLLLASGLAGGAILAYRQRKPLSVR